MYSYVIIFRCIVKANYWGEDTAHCPCPTISKQKPCRVSDGPSLQKFMFVYRSFHLAFLATNNKLFTRFSHGPSRLPVSTLTLTLHTHTITTVSTTQSHICGRL